MPEQVLEPAAGQHSFLVWFIMTLGQGGLIIALTALLAFVMTLLVVLRGKGPAAGPALIFIVPLPILAAIFWELKGMIASFAVIAVSDTQLKGSEVAAGIAENLATMIFALMSMGPSYGLAMIYLFRRAIQPETGSQVSNTK